MKSKKPAQIQNQKTDWSNVAEWYDRLVGDAGSEYHQHVVLPGVMRLLDLQPKQRIVDVACGQGVLCRLLRERGAEVTGIDAAEPLIKAARSVVRPTFAIRSATHAIYRCSRLTHLTPPHACSRFRTFIRSSRCSKALPVHSREWRAIRHRHDASGIPRTERNRMGLGRDRQSPISPRRSISHPAKKSRSSRIPARRRMFTRGRFTSQSSHM